MFIEVDVQENANCSFALSLIYSALGTSVPIAWVFAPGPRGDTDAYQVTGWSAEGPCQAYAAPVEDSGEGRVLLVYGGDEGIRPKPRGSSEPWSIESEEQWGEPCLLLDPNVEMG